MPPLLITIGPALTIVPHIPPQFIGDPGLIEFTAAGAEGAVRWQLISSTLPAEWDAAFTVTDGVASLAAEEVEDPSGSPYSVTVRLLDLGARRSVQQTFPVRVVALPLTITGELDPWTYGVTVTDVLTVSGGVGGYQDLAVIAGALPSGVSVSLVGDEIQFSGAPTAAGAWSATVSVADAASTVVTRSLSGTVAVPDLQVTGTLPAADEGSAYSETLTVSGGLPPYTFVSSSGVPAGLSVDLTGSTLTVSGTPEAGSGASSPYSLSITVADSLETEEVFSQSFEVTAAPTDPHWANVWSLMHFDGADGSTTLTDEKGLTWSRFGDAQIDTAQSVFGGASLLLDGTGDRLSTPHSAGLFSSIATGDYTIEMWIRPANVSGTKNVAYWSGYSWGIYLSGATPRVWDGADAIVSSVNVSAATWTHIAVTRESGKTKLWVGGQFAGEAPGTRMSQNVSSDGTFHLGSYLGGDSSLFNGHVDELRFTKSVARYTSAFTPPDAPFPESGP